MKQWQLNQHPADWKSSNWANNCVFNLGWRPDQVVVGDYSLDLRLDDVPSFGYPYTSGEYRTTDHYTYGLYEVHMMPAKSEGVVSSFFLYTGPSENNPHDEIDIEFPGKDTTKVQFNYFTDDQGHNEYIHNLPFDAATAFHTYGVEWHPDFIAWSVEGSEVYRVSAATAQVPLPTHAGKIMVNLWTGSGDGEVWLGPSAYQQPLHARYEWVRYTP